jgi:SAM-dependent methyltransferase
MTASISTPRTGWSDRVRNPALAIALVTFGTLALELALIRWTSSQVRVFAYFNNIVLICAFLGIGLGIAVGARRPGFAHLVLPVLLALALPLAFSEALGLVFLRFPDRSIILWGGQQLAGDPPLFLRNMSIFGGLLTLVIGVFFGCGAALGALFGRLTALRSYQADLFGSLLGVLVFTAAAWLDAGPAVWLALGCIPFVLLTRSVLAAIVAAAVIGLGQYSVHDAMFSPYNRIDLLRDASNNIELRVNRDFHQYMFDLSDARIADPKSSTVEHDSRVGVRELYDLPFTLNAKRTSALVVGAGTGNDVQAALRNGYQHVASVDIDGRIIALGKKLHPEQPYSNGGVEPIVDDARAFFEKDRGRTFDIVCYGLLDSHAMSSAMSTLRLDNYVYTEEGIRAAWRRVAPGGHLSLALSCMAGYWFYERLHWTITRATGREPIDYYSALHGGTVTFVVPRGDALLHDPAAAGRVLLRPKTPPERTLTTSDDWPFLYIRADVIPWGYMTILGFLLLVALVSVPKVFQFGTDSGGFHGPLFLMGAAFLLIETRGVTSLSLLFGSTWIVNSAVFAGILVMVLLGNTLVRRSAWVNPQPWFIALFAAVALLYVFPLGWLHTLPLLGRGVAGGLLTGLPIGIAGVIVPMLLARAPSAVTALGSNLLGAVLGGCLEYLSMYAGLRAMALVALALYLMAYLGVRRMDQKQSRGAAGGVPRASAPPALT